MNEQYAQSLARVIGAIGQPRFAEVAAHALCRMADFQLGSVVLHHARAHPQLVFDDLGAAGYRTGMENYLRRTHRSNPMLADEATQGPYRASDFRLHGASLRADLAHYLIPAPEEELGFRTIGWPCGMEEVGLVFHACGGTIELSLYRERARKAAPLQTLRALGMMRAPLAAAFERHGQMRHDAGALDLALLTRREREIVDLLLAGCASEAIALRVGITRHTVKDHRKAIFRKLRIGSLAELFAQAHARG